MKCTGSCSQNQKFCLCFGAALLLLLMVNHLVFAPAKMAAAESRIRMGRLDEKISRADRLKSRSGELLHESKNTATEILAVIREKLPPDAGRYSWALNWLSEVAEEAGVDFSIHPHPHPRYIPVRTREKLNVNSIPLWVPYAIDVDLETGFAEMIQFMARLHEAQPYCSIAALEITALRSTPEKHRIRMTLEWPVLRFAEDAQQLHTFSAQ